MTDNNEEDSLFDLGLKEGIKIGESLGEYNTYNRVVNAIALGELDLFLELNEPKSAEGWEAWVEKHGPLAEFRTRWDHPAETKEK